MANHLTLEDRDRIAQFRHQGLEQKEIADVLGRAPSTICRELQRNSTGGEYLAGQAQQQAERRRRERPIARRMDDSTIEEDVRGELAECWSPEQISGRMQQQHPDDLDRRISPQTNYDWVADDEDREHWVSFFATAGQTRQPPKKHGNR